MRQDRRHHPFVAAGQEFGRTLVMDIKEQIDDELRKREHAE
jgi:hypothetical protein